MADLSTFLGGSGSGGGPIKLAPQLTGFPLRTPATPSYPTTTVSGINISTGATMLNLSGKWLINSVQLTGMTASVDTTINLAIDGTTIWNQSGINHTRTIYNLFGSSGIQEEVLEFIVCETSFVLTVTQSGNTSATVNYLARPLA